ncbi:MarR family winged helix-turn-helix transcriptional regulator [Phaeovulum sp.]|uniref:MarR family winged helix-turn-helix transcriptional regulator n=1 Tax=Phaeovulum sp. TaxID=2934796 RepID=UPI0039E2B265
MTHGTDSLGFLLHDAARLIRRRFEARAADLGLTSAQWRALVHILRAGNASQARLAERLEIEPISVSRLVDRMVEGGWVTRKADPSDRRARIVVPTSKSLKTYEEARSVADVVYAQALTGLPAETRETLMRALRAIVCNLSEPDEILCSPAKNEALDDH